MPPQQQYDFDAVGRVASWSSDAIERWLRQQPRTVSVTNVERDPRYQAQDIDLLLSRRSLAGVVTEHKIEIKADQIGNKTKNFFFETISNVDTGTPGCFMYSEADHLYYHLVVTGQVYILDFAETRRWFIRNMSKFRDHRTRTLLAHGASYETEGRIVPIRTVVGAVPALAIVHLPPIPSTMLQRGTAVGAPNR